MEAAPCVFKPFKISHGGRRPARRRQRVLMLRRPRDLRGGGCPRQLVLLYHHPARISSLRSAALAMRNGGKQQWPPRRHSSQGRRLSRWPRHRPPLLRRPRPYPRSETSSTPSCGTRRSSARFSRRATPSSSATVQPFPRAPASFIDPFGTGLYGFDRYGLPVSALSSFQWEYWGSILDILRTKVGAEVLAVRVPR